MTARTRVIRPELARHLAGRAQVRLTRLETPDQVREATRDADAVIVTTNPLTAAHIAALGDGVRVIGRAGTGLDAIDLEAARARGNGSCGASSLACWRSSTAVPCALGSAATTIGNARMLSPQASSSAGSLSLARSISASRIAERIAAAIECGKRRPVDGGHGRARGRAWYAARVARKNITGTSSEAMDALQQLFVEVLTFMICVGSVLIIFYAAYRLIKVAAKHL